LERASYKVTHAGDGLVADQQLRAYEFDLVVLDLGLPDMDGLEVLRALRQRKQAVPVLVLTARDGMDQQIESLDAGADDYMEKPFDLRELQARVRALLRRGTAEIREKIELGPLYLDLFQRTATLSGKLLELPVREFEVLETLVVQSARYRQSAPQSAPCAAQRRHWSECCRGLHPSFAPPPRPLGCVYSHRARRRLFHRESAVRRNAQ
ncbi:response regulator transcription factor, partial [Gammaproteobacteria bacterium]|nr:response regulator transcription factor [Gammaproteobacteria bacterium]